MGTWKCFLKYEKYFLHPYPLNSPPPPPPSPPQSTAHPQILEYIWCFHQLQIISTPPNLIILSGLPTPFLLDTIWNKRPKSVRENTILRWQIKWVKFRCRSKYLWWSNVTVVNSWLHIEQGDMVQHCIFYSTKTQQNFRYN